MPDRMHACPEASRPLPRRLCNDGAMTGIVAQNPARAVNYEPSVPSMNSSSIGRTAFGFGI